MCIAEVGDELRTAEVVGVERGWLVVLIVEEEFAWADQAVVRGYGYRAVETSADVVA